MDAINAAFTAKEGCLVKGWLRVQRVAGNLHVSVHMDDFIMLERVCLPPMLSTSLAHAQGWLLLHRAATVMHTLLNAVASTSRSRELLPHIPIIMT